MVSSRANRARLSGYLLAYVKPGSGEVTPYCQVACAADAPHINAASRTLDLRSRFVDGPSIERFQSYDGNVEQREPVTKAKWIAVGSP